MAYLYEIFTSQNVSPAVIMVRLSVSMLMGFAIGAEREIKRSPAGLRTHILICVGSTLIMLLSIYVPQTYRGFPGGDPSRIAAQVVSGIGFLGAGTIMRLGVNIKGLTTAASIWAVAALGLVTGAGMLFASIMGTLIVLFILIVLDAIERRYFRSGYTRLLRLDFKRGRPPVDDVRKVLSGLGVKHTLPDISYSMKSDASIMKVPVTIPVDVDFERLYEVLERLDSVQRIRIEQL